MKRKMVSRVVELPAALWQALGCYAAVAAAPTPLRWKNAWEEGPGERVEFLWEGPAREIALFMLKCLGHVRLSRRLTVQWIFTNTGIEMRQGRRVRRYLTAEDYRDTTTIHVTIVKGKVFFGGLRAPTRAEILRELAEASRKGRGRTYGEVTWTDLGWGRDVSSRDFIEALAWNPVTNAMREPPAVAMVSEFDRHWAREVFQILFDLCGGLLTKKQRKLYDLLYLQGLSKWEAAEKLRRGIRAVERMLDRMIKKLEKNLPPLKHFLFQ